MSLKQHHLTMIDDAIHQYTVACVQATKASAPGHTPDMRPYRRALDQAIANYAQACRVADIEPKGFDVEAAKRGEPIEVNNAVGDWVPAQFIGMTSGGRIAIEFGADGVCLYTPDQVRMVPKKPRVVFVQFYAGGKAEWFDREIIGVGSTNAFAYNVPVELPE